LALEVVFMRKAGLATIVFACGLASLAAQGQVLEMSAPPESRSRADVPTRGMSMTQVESRFGAPTERYAAVGQPPISRWVYPSFVVFFEYSHVVHAVAVAPPARTP
jgi:hypothetical protein